MPRKNHVRIRRDRRAKIMISRVRLLQLIETCREMETTSDTVMLKGPARCPQTGDPPLGLEAVPPEGLQVAFDEILAAPTTKLLLVGVYAKALPELDQAMTAYRQTTNPLADAPSIRVLRFAQLEVADM